MLSGKWDAIDAFIISFSMPQQLLLDRRQWSLEKRGLCSVLPFVLAINKLLVASGRSWSAVESVNVLRIVDTPSSTTKPKIKKRNENKSDAHFFYYLFSVLVHSLVRLDASSQPKSQLSPIFGRFNFWMVVNRVTAIQRRILVAYDGNSAQQLISNSAPVQQKQSLDEIFSFSCENILIKRFQN